MKHRNPTVRVISKSHPGRGAFRGSCCWPDCDGTVIDDLVPLCQIHHEFAWRTFKQMSLWWYDEMFDWTNNPDRVRHVREQEAKPAPASPEGLVYFVRLGDRVKIGFTTNLEARLAVVPHEEVLGVVDGTMKDERRCHAAFAHLRVHREWFRLEPDLVAFIADVARPYGPPARQLDSSPEALKR